MRFCFRRDHEHESSTGRSILALLFGWQNLKHMMLSRGCFCQLWGLHWVGTNNNLSGIHPSDYGFHSSSLSEDKSRIMQCASSVRSTFCVGKGAKVPPQGFNFGQCSGPLASALSWSCCSYLDKATWLFIFLLGQVALCFKCMCMWCGSEGKHMKFLSLWFGGMTTPRAQNLMNLSKYLV